MIMKGFQLIFTNSPDEFALIAHEITHWKTPTSDRARSGDKVSEIRNSDRHSIRL